MDQQYAQYLLAKTKDDYNNIADDFSATRQNIWPEMKPLFDYIKRGDKALDLGCGNGRCVEAIREKGGLYWGVDNSDNLIKIARNKYPNGKFLAADALDLPFENEFFNIIYSIAVLHHIPSKNLRRKFMSEAKRALKPGGFFILTVWKPKDKQEISLFLRHLMLKILSRSKMDFRDVSEPWSDRAERYYHCFSIRELKGLAHETGWQIIKSGLIKNERGNRNNIYLVAKKSYKGRIAKS